MKRLVVSTALLLTVGTSFGMSEDIFARQHPSEVTEVAKGYHLLATMPETKEAIEGLVHTIDGVQPTPAMTSTSMQGITLEELSHAVKGHDSVTPSVVVSHITAKPIHGITMDE